MSDTHNCQLRLPDGDVLVHAGDLTQSGSLMELQATVNWLCAQPHAIKIVMAGNHDLFLDVNFPGCRSKPGKPLSSPNTSTVDWGDIIYLQDTETTITCVNGRCLRIYGSPYSFSQAW